MKHGSEALVQEVEDIIREHKEQGCTFLGFEDSLIIYSPQAGVTRMHCAFCEEFLAQMTKDGDMIWIEVPYQPASPGLSGGP